MHGHEGEERKRRQHMWSVPAPGTAAEVEKPAVIQPPPVPAANLIQTSADSFLKDGRKIQVGDCALFQAGNAPPFIGIIRWFSTDKEAYLKLCVNWLYRPADVKLAKGIIPEAAPNEVFYSFHKDVISAASLLHPCKVSFLRKGIELPLGISSFVCRRVYDIRNKCLWWLTDQDYINEHQEEVDQLLDKTRLEMHAAVQSGGRSPKRMNIPASTDQLKSGSDSVQNSGNSFSSQIKGKKRDRGDHATEPIKRERNSRADDGDSTGCNFDNNMLKSEISKITEKGALVSTDGVEKLVQLMQVDNSKKIDLTCRVLLADVIAATERGDCLNKFVQIRGVPVLDEWLQEAHKGKAGDRNSPKESDKAVEELLLALLRALDKLPVNLNALQTCNIGKSVNHLRSHKNVEIQKKARSLVDTWKKRVDAEMKTNDAKPVGSSQAVTWPVKTGFSDVSNVGNRRTGSGDLSLKSSITQQSTSKVFTGRSVIADTVKSTSVFVGSGKQHPSSLVPAVTSSKDSLSKLAVGSGISDLPQIVVKEAKSSSSSQSCSSDHGKAVASSLKEDARSSTAGSLNAYKTSGGSLRPRRSSNGFAANIISGGQKETISSKPGLLIRNSTGDKVSQAGISYEKAIDMPASDHGSNHRLIVRLPNPGRSPARSTSGGSLEDPSAGSRASSPSVLDKHEHGDGKVIGRDYVSRTYTTDINGESWQSNDVKEGLAVCDEGDRSPTIILNEEGRQADESLRAVETSRTACSSSGNDKVINVAEPKMRNSFSSMNALIESCAKYSEATTPLSGGDDIGMNLLASVAAGEMSKSDIVSPASSPGSSPATEDACNGTNEAKSRFSTDDSGCRNIGQSDENADFDSEKHEKAIVPLFSKDEIQEVALNFPRDNIGSAPSLLKDKAQQNELLPDMKEEFIREDEHQNQDDRKISRHVGDCISEVRSLTDQIKNSSSAHEIIVEGTKFTSDSGHKSQSHAVDFEDSASCRNIDKAVIGEDFQAIDTLTGQKLHSVTETETVVERNGLEGTASVTDKVSCPENTELSKSKMLDSSDGQCQEQIERNGSTILPSNNKPHAVSASSPLGMANGVETLSRQASLEKHDASSDDLDHLSAVHRETEASAKMSVVEGERKEEVALSAEISPFVATTDQDVGAKLDFDLNEGIIGDDMNQTEPISTAVPVYSPAIRISSFSSLPPSPIISGLPAPITVAAPAKGPFMPPENLLKSKGELGWKGSAATSAFRPAEPRKVLEMQLNTSDVQSSDSTTTKQGRPPLEIDLNVADDTSMEDIASQNSTQTTGSESGVISNHDVPARAVGLEFDLNRVDEGPENGQFFASTNHLLDVPLLPSKPATKRFPNGEVNMFRDFDLNNGPGIDDFCTEPLQRSQNVKNSNNMPYVPPVTGFRMNNTELGSGWFPAGNTYPAVTIPSFLPDRGEQSYPMVAAAGAQRILGSVTSSGSFGGDVYRGPVLSSSPAMAFSPAATAFSYTGFPFGSTFPLASTSFSPGSTNYVDSSSGGSYFPQIPSPLMGAPGAVTSSYARPYMISLPEGSSVGGSDSTRKWGRHGLDLNAGPGNAEEVKDDRVPSTRQMHAASSQGFIDDHSRLYQVSGGVLKRKEPDGGWEPERYTFKQPSWQ